MASSITRQAAIGALEEAARYVGTELSNWTSGPLRLRAAGDEILNALALLRVEPEAKTTACLEANLSRCEVCDWPLAKSADEGCVPGNCSYRPNPNSEEGHRIAARRKYLASLAPTSEVNQVPPASDTERKLREALAEYVRDFGDNEDSDSQRMAEGVRAALALPAGQDGWHGKFQIGQRVKQIDGHQFAGSVCAIYYAAALGVEESERYVVQHADGWQQMFSATQLEAEESHPLPAPPASGGEG